MRIKRFLIALLAIVKVVKAAPSDDMASLQASCENAANVLNTSLNNTMGMNTSSLIQNITWQVGASKANLGNTNSSTSSPQACNITSPLDAIYFGYADSLGTLSEALIRRGRIFHQEMNLPIYSALQGLATAVQAYGLQLRNACLISQNATIRTITAGSDIVEAESAWATNANYPGRRVKRSMYGN